MKDQAALVWSEYGIDSHARSRVGVTVRYLEVGLWQQRAPR